ncbi:alanine:cation symporter family protein [Glutamicibacter sp. JL.03c]|uniref:alanine/glycine:cation symporter family protein n=1 Tax=Glutamicibacter sp. JL.03c TaxID=2984842 RepID=UPI0021F7141E|nr:alanine/glycine:cation symporter family protein [Glutamicibacter sp. JL.03c]UYQ77297.1 alanine:cation symporter family protein [Glutamicibacter sp. JL.03c]
MNIDAFLEEKFGSFAESFSAIIFFEIPLFGTHIPVIVTWIVVCGLFFTVKLRALNLRGMKHACDLVRGKFPQPNAPGEATHFQALATAVSSTVGLGTIAGVAIAITVGGPGAVFWMFIAGFFAMSTKMAECLLGVAFRRISDGKISGGPMYYLKSGLAHMGHRKLGAFLAAGWAACMMIAAMGTNAFQSNQATAQLVSIAAGSAAGDFLASNKWVIGVVLAVFAGAVIIGGVRSIAKAAGVLVPLMTVFYFMACAVVLLVNITELPGALMLILSEAFKMDSATGGAIGALIIGFQRATYANSAGVGDAPIAHSIVKTNRPATEGLVAGLEPFADTVILCSITALTIVVTGAWNDPANVGADGVVITSNAFASAVSWFPYVLTVAVVLFAFTTIMSNSYYGMKAFCYFFKDNPIAETVYKCFFLCFTVIGAAVSLDPVISFADSMFFLMAVFNVIGLYLMSGLIKREFIDYWQLYTSGKLDLESMTAPKDITEMLDARYEVPLEIVSRK